MKKTSKSLIILEYIVGILLLICSIQMFADVSIIGGICMVISALICIPASRLFLEQKIKIQFGRIAKYAIVLFGWLSIAIFGKSQTADAPEKNMAVLPEVEKVAAPTQQPVTVDTTTIPAQVTAPENNNIVASQVIDTSSLADYSIEETPVEDVPQEKKTKSKSSYGGGNTSGGREYTVGPRGGCFYINSSGKKVYVDHSYCN